MSDHNSPFVFCDFCGKHQFYVKRLISADGPDGRRHICNECVSSCMEIASDVLPKEVSATPKAREMWIVLHIDQGLMPSVYGTDPRHIPDHKMNGSDEIIHVREVMD